MASFTSLLPNTLSLCALVKAAGLHVPNAAEVPKEQINEDLQKDTFFFSPYDDSVACLGLSFFPVPRVLSIDTSLTIPESYADMSKHVLNLPALDMSLSSQRMLCNGSVASS